MVKRLSSAWKHSGEVIRQAGGLRYTLVLLALALAYVVAAKVGLSLAVSTEQVTTVWPPTAIALTITILGGYRFLPGIYLGAFIANALSNEPLWVAAAIAVGNTLEAFVAAWLLRRIAKFRPAFESAWDMVAFLAFVGLVSTPAAATIGTLSLAAGGLVTPEQFWRAWYTWWAGDAMAGLILGPFLLVWASRTCREVLRGRKVEAGIGIAIMAAAGMLAFTLRINPVWPVPLTTYIIFPLFILAAFRFDRIGVTSATIVVAAMALWASLNGMGPFNVDGLMEHNLIFLQLFILVLFSTSMFLAITVARRARAEAGLRRMAAELKDANQRATNVLAEVMETIAPKNPGNPDGPRA